MTQTGLDAHRRLYSSSLRNSLAHADGATITAAAAPTHAYGSMQQGSDEWTTQVKVRHTDGRRPSYVSIAPEDESRLSRVLLTRKYKQTAVKSFMVVDERLLSLQA
jgi:hypothetical protein